MCMSTHPARALLLSRRVYVATSKGTPLQASILSIRMPQRRSGTTSVTVASTAQPIYTGKPSKPRSSAGRVLLLVVLAFALLLLLRTRSLVEDIGSAAPLPVIAQPAATAAAGAAVALAQPSAAQAALTSRLDTWPTRPLTWLPQPVAEAEMAAARNGLARVGLRDLGGRAGDAFLIGVRPTTGTVDAVSPVSLPTFSFTMPIKGAVPCANAEWPCPDGACVGSTPHPDRKPLAYSPVRAATLTWLAVA